MSPLLSASGERIILDGYWVDESAGVRLDYWIQTEGNCLWAAGQRNATPFEQAFVREDVQLLRGTIQSDFTVDGEIVLLGPTLAGNEPANWAPARFLIEPGDDGQLTLREDRERGVPGPRCPEPTYDCLKPLVLIRESGE
ncbi:MAG TPA: hypothetical protein VFP83_05530 [Candidatus Limnocylindria bacterium]|nr:hypothetical protein [Candidatus Limnocylindria bacterium]